MTDEKQKAQYAKPASQVDLEERLEKDNASNKVLSTAEVRRGEEVSNDGRTYAVEGNKLDGYVGVSAEYATYANETEAPLVGESEDSAEAQVFDSFATQLNELETTGRIGEDSNEVDEKEEEEAKAKAPTKSSTSSSTSTSK